jgi:hypothetical protein
MAAAPVAAAVPSIMELTSSQCADHDVNFMIGAFGW